MAKIKSDDRPQCPATTRAFTTSDANAERCTLPFGHDGDHEAHVDGGSTRWTRDP